MRGWWQTALGIPRAACLLFRFRVPFALLSGYRLRAPAVQTAFLTRRHDWLQHSGRNTLHRFFIQNSNSPRFGPLGRTLCLTTVLVTLQGLVVSTYTVRFNSKYLCYLPARCGFVFHMVLKISFISLYSVHSSRSTLCFVRKTKWIVLYYTN